MLAGIHTSDLDVELWATVAGTNDDRLTCKGAQGFKDGLAELFQGWDELGWAGVVDVVGNCGCTSFELRKIEMFSEL